jgi:hypothetical protein
MDTVDEVEVKQECIACNGELVDTDTTFTTDSGDTVCENCMIVCEKCDIIITCDDEYNSVGSQIWCQGCLRNDATWCDMCDEYFAGYSYTAEDSSDNMCESCYERNTSYCEDCDATYVNG